MRIRSISQGGTSVTFNMDECPEREELLRRVVEAATRDDPYTMVTTLFEEGSMSRLVWIQIAADHTDVFEGGLIHMGRQRTAVSAAYAVLEEAFDRC